MQGVGLLSADELTDSEIYIKKNKKIHPEDWEELPELRGSEFLAVVQPETQSYSVR